MRLRRVVSGLMAFSPLLALGTLGWRGRADLGTSIAGDPPGYAERLGSYKGFVLACRDLGSKESVISAIDALPPSYPVLESAVEGLTAREDVRRPIVVAEDRCFRKCRESFDTMLRRNRYGDAAQLALGMHRLSLVTRYFDFYAFMTASAQTAVAADALRRAMKVLGPADAAQLRSEVLRAEASRHSPLDVMRNDVRLLGVDYVRTEAGEKLDPAIPQAAAQAFQAVRKSGNLEAMMARVERWERTVDKDRLWSLLAGWQIMLRRDSSDSALVRQAVRVTAAPKSQPKTPSSS